MRVSAVTDTLSIQTVISWTGSFFDLATVLEHVLYNLYHHLIALFLFTFTCYRK